MSAQPAHKLKILTFVVKAFFITVFFLLMLSFFTIMIYSYEQFTLWIIQVYEKADKLDEFRSLYLTEERFRNIRIITGILIVGFSFVLFRLSKHSGRIIQRIISWNNSFRDFGQYIQEYYTPMNRQQKIIFWSTILFLVVARWFFLHRYYLQNDELFSYLFFVRKGLFVLTSYYPGPNNHVFYSFLAYCTQSFSWSPFYTMKLPSFVAGSLAPVFLFLLLKRSYRFSVSILGTLLFACSIHFFYYSLFGRGYVLMTFFSVFAFFMASEIMTGKKDLFLWHIYSLASILGFYTLPSYLYLFASLAIAMAFAIVIYKRKDQVKTYLYYHGVIVVVVVVLYSPIIVVSGLASLTSNPWVARLESEEFFTLFPGMIRNMFGYLAHLEEGAVWYSVLLFSITGIILFRTKNLLWSILLSSCFILPVLMLLIQRVHPFDRVWTYLILPYTLCMVVIIAYLIEWWKEEMIEIAGSMLVSLGIISYTLYYFYTDTNHGHMIYDEVSRISREVVKESKGKIYTNEDLYNLYIRYESSQTGHEMIPDMTINNGVQQYSHLLLIPGSSFPGSVRKEDYVLKEQNSYIEVYKLK